MFYFFAMLNGGKFKLYTFPNGLLFQGLLSPGFRLTYDILKYDLNIQLFN
jgi:hypothetical protein